MYDVIRIAVFVEMKEMDKYFNLFRFMLRDKITEFFIERDYAKIITSDMVLEFIQPTLYYRGLAVHYSLNLTQDKEFDDQIAKPISYRGRYLKDDPKWAMLFDVNRKF